MVSTCDVFCQPYKRVLPLPEIEVSHVSSIFKKYLVKKYLVSDQTIGAREHKLMQLIIRDLSLKSS